MKIFCCAMFQCKKNPDSEHPETPARSDASETTRARDAMRKNASRTHAKQMVHDYNAEEDSDTSRDTTQSDVCRKKRGPKAAYTCGRCHLVMSDTEQYARHSLRVNCGGSMISTSCVSCETDMGSWDNLKNHVEEVR